MSLNYFDEEEFESTKNFDARTFRRILSLTRPHIKWVIGFLLAILMVSVLDSYFTFLSKRIIDEGIVARNVAALKSILLTYGLLTVVQALGVFCFIYLVGVLGERIRYDLRRSMFNHLQALSLSYYSKTPVGWIMSRVTSDSERVSELITWGLLDFYLGDRKHHHLNGLHADHQLAPGVDCVCYPAYPAVCCHRVSQTHSYPVSESA